jgi:hypothetical protein
MKVKDLFERKGDKMAQAMGLATAWYKSNFKNFDLPLKTMRIPTSGQYIFATSVKNPSWDTTKRVYVKVIDGEVRQTTVQKWNQVVQDRKAMRAQSQQQQAPQQEE